MTDKRIGRPPGSPNKKGRKPNRAKSPSGPHRGAPPDRLARLRALVDAVGLAPLASLVGTRPGQIGPILRGERSIGEARLGEWERAVASVAQ
jgi:hypothetical protein